MTTNTITPALQQAVSHALISVQYATTNLIPEYVTFSGPGYNFKVINTEERLERFAKSLEEARLAARRKPWSPTTIAKQIQYGNTARGIAEARARLDADDYGKYFTHRPN